VLKLAYLKKVINLFLGKTVLSSKIPRYKDRRMKSKPKALCVAESGTLSPDAARFLFFFFNKLIKTSLIFPLIKEIIL